MDSEHVGGTIRTLRKAAGLTQAQLARRASVSLSLLSTVERGDRAATHALLVSVARALRVPVGRLTGQPYADNHHDAATHAAVDALRAVLRRIDLPGDTPPRPLNDLTVEVATVAALRRDANYRRLSALLPGVLDGLARAAHSSGADAGTAVHRLLVTTYHAAHMMLHRLGFPDLAELVEHRLAAAAEHTGDPLAGALAMWVRAQTSQSAGDYTHGLLLMEHARTRFEDQLRHDPSPAALTVFGNLHLRSVTLASRAGDAHTTRAHLAEARELATRLGGPDQVHYGLTFGAANVTAHETAAHIELGDATAALKAADHWRPSPTMPRTRRGHHHISLARAHLLHGDRHAALTALQRARRIAPQQTRLHPMVRDTTAVLVSLHRRSTPELSDYAGWLGLTH
ncbi:helix-turn-helix domain-containing protein [Saccharomonospora xinjiangensis]|nr:anaerobic benzoate catabolism transcriptional regulator [Saccharomonospora xinjiangensis]